MSFKIVSQPEFSRRVAVRVPCDGGFDEQSLEVRFRVLSPEEQEKLKGSDDMVGDFLRRAVISMGDIVDEDGNELPFNDALRDRLLALPFVRFALARAYGDAVAGERAKN